MSTTAAPASAPTTNGTVHENALQRVSGYPAVASSLETLNGIIASNALAASLLARSTELSQLLINHLAPVLPLAQVDGLANQGLDILEKRFPVVKSDDLTQYVRGPAEEAVGVARAYAGGVQSRLSPITEQISTRIIQTQDTIKAVQDRVAVAIAGVPHDKASLQEALQNLYKEIDGLSAYFSNAIKHLPANAQTTAKPYIEGLQEGANHIRDELSKPDVAFSAKATNVLNYTKDKLSPILVSIKDVVVKGKVEVEKAEVQVEAQTKATVDAVKA